jgi:hypothetical protein
MGQPMKRRDFFKPIAAGALTGLCPDLAFAADATHAAEVPRIPFDAPEGSWTLAVFPDCQSLTRLHPEVFVRQAEWVAAHRKSHDIRFLIQLGDITDNNLPAQWENAKKAMDVLKQGGVPYSVLPGNHDLGPNGKSADRSTLLNEYFTPADYEGRKVIYFEEGKLENTCHEFTSPQGDFFVISLEFAPRNEVIAWADQQAASHPKHTIIVATHAYLFSDDTRYDFPAKGKAQTWNPNVYGVAKLAEVNDGEAMWKKLVSRHPNIRFVLNGHVLNDGAGRLVSEGSGGNKVHQILSNFQNGVKPDRPFHGGGFFRLMQFLPDRKTVRVKTYSPWLDQWLDDEQQQFELLL